MSTFTQSADISLPINIPLDRDQVILLLVAVNQFFLSLDTYLVHFANGTARTRELIPVYFGIIAGITLLICGLLALRYRALAASLATFIFVTSVIVGILGAYFHFVRGILPTAPAGQRVTLDLLIWAPPILAPFAFTGVGLMGMSAAWQENPLDSGILQFGNRTIRLPFSKTRAYLFYVAMGILVALISATLDHARHWENGWLWLPSIVGIFATLVTTLTALVNNVTLRDIQTYLVTMGILLITGLIGLGFHIDADLTAQNNFVLERFLRGAPILAPLLYCNMALIGIAVLLPSKTD